MESEKRVCECDREQIFGDLDGVKGHVEGVKGYPLTLINRIRNCWTHKVSINPALGQFFLFDIGSHIPVPNWLLDSNASNYMQAHVASQAIYRAKPRPMELC